MKTFWWICLFFLFLTVKYGITGANQDSNDDDDYNVYEDTSVTDVPKATEAQAINNENDDFDNDSNENEQQTETTSETENEEFSLITATDATESEEYKNQEEDPEQARAQLESLPKNQTELGMIKQLLLRLDSNNQRNFIIICSVLGSGLFLVIVILLCLVCCIEELRPDDDKLIEAEEGRANTED